VWTAWVGGRLGFQVGAILLRARERARSKALRPAGSRYPSRGPFRTWVLVGPSGVVGSSRGGARTGDNECSEAAEEGNVVSVAPYAHAPTRSQRASRSFLGTRPSLGPSARVVLSVTPTRPAQAERGDASGRYRRRKSHASGPKRCRGRQGGDARLATSSTLLRELLGAQTEGGCGLRPARTDDSGLCSHVVCVAEVVERRLASNKLWYAPQKGGLTRVNGGLARAGGRHSSAPRSREGTHGNRVVSRK
jgi:hypothetical protein